jgi:hypothetical protein
MALSGRHQQLCADCSFDFAEVLNVGNGKYAHAGKEWNVLSSGVVCSL